MSRRANRRRSSGRRTGRSTTSPVGCWLVLLLVAASCTSDTAGPSTNSSAQTTTTSVASSTPVDEEPRGSTTAQPPTDAIAPVAGALVPVVVATHPHDATAYTQGLELLDGLLLEGTGRYGESERRLVDITSGEVVDREPLPDDVFGEGLTVVGDDIFQLTWRAETFYRADAASLDTEAQGAYRGEGWGLCYDGTSLVMSNGSAQLTLRDPVTFEPRATVEVTRADGTAVDQLNELECVAGQVWANVYRSDEIVVIDPGSGVVEATIDASTLRPEGLPIDDADFALNGIAVDRSTGHAYLTGKWWPVLYEVTLTPE